MCRVLRAYRCEKAPEGGKLRYCIAQNFGGIKLWQINCVRVFSEENVGEFTIATLVNLEFGWVKY